MSKKVKVRFDLHGIKGGTDCIQEFDSEEIARKEIEEWIAKTQFYAGDAEIVETFICQTCKKEVYSYAGETHKLECQ